MSRRDDTPPSIDPPRPGTERRADGRREPSMGWLDELDLARNARLRRAPKAQPSLRWLWWLGGLLVLMALVVALRQPIADRLWPETRAQALRAQADAALAQNRLTAADGSGARELYEAALAVDPDRNEARTGLMRVAGAALAEARSALAQNRFADAHRHLALARALSVPEAQADAVADALRQRESTHAGIDGLVAKADAARRAGRLDGDDAALPLYRRVLELQPGRTDALRGREDVLTDLLEAARASLRRGDLRDAAAKIDIARKYDAGHVDLPDSMARLTEETEALRRRADDDLRRGRLQQAGEGYRVLQAFDRDDADAARGVAGVAAAHAARAQVLAADFEFAAAEAALGEARALAPDMDEVREAERSLARARQARAQFAPRLPAGERQRRVRTLLDEAAAAEDRGDLLTPPGDSAFDKLRAARALAPDDAAVRRASARLLPAAIACFDRELRGNSLGRARACLDARGLLGDDDPALAAARRRLAQRWLAIGAERLGAGEMQSAAAALASARGTDPGAPGIDDFAERLRTATASGD